MRVLLLSIMFLNICQWAGCQGVFGNCDPSFKKAFFLCPEFKNRERIGSDEIIYFEAMKNGNRFDVILTKGSSSNTIKDRLTEIFKCIDASKIETEEINGIYLHREYDGIYNENEILPASYQKMIEKFKKEYEIQSNVCIHQTGWFPPDK